MTTSRSIDFSRATASAICNSSSRLALTAGAILLFSVGGDIGIVFPALSFEAFPYEVIAHDELGLAQLLERQAENLRLRVTFDVALHKNFATFHTLQQAAETLSARHGLGKLDLHVEALPTLEILGPRQRAIDARRGNLEIVFAGDRVLDVEDGRESAREFFAILDRHGAVGALCHDLERLPVLQAEADAHDLEADALGARAQKVEDLARPARGPRRDACRGSLDPSH